MKSLLCKTVVPPSSLESRLEFKFRAKFSFSEKATKICRNLPQGLELLNSVQTLRKFFSNFVAFSEHLNFKTLTFVWILGSMDYSDLQKLAFNFCCKQSNLKDQ